MRRYTVIGPSGLHKWRSRHVSYVQQHVLRDLECVRESTLQRSNEHLTMTFPVPQA
jgi:hypothetical protein